MAARSSQGRWRTLAAARGLRPQWVEPTPPTAAPRSADVGQLFGVPRLELCSFAPSGFDILRWHGGLKMAV